MAARRPPHRRWLVRRRRFQDAQGAQVTHTWLNIPFLPRHIRSWSSSYGHLRVTRLSISSGNPPPVGCAVIIDGILVVLLVVDISHAVMTGQWISRIPDYLVMMVGLCFGNFLWWRGSHQP